MAPTNFSVNLQWFEMTFLRALLNDSCRKLVEDTLRAHKRVVSSLSYKHAFAHLACKSFCCKHTHKTFPHSNVTMHRGDVFFFATQTQQRQGRSYLNKTHAQTTKQNEQRHASKPFEHNNKENTKTGNHLRCAPPSPHRAQRPRRP